MLSSTDLTAGAIAPPGVDKAKFRIDIQALRGWSVIVVILYHSGTSLAPAGYLGVDIFFVISGYLITGLIASSLSKGAFRFSDFYYRRAKRILPAALVVVLVTSALAPFFLLDRIMIDLIPQVIGAVTFTINIVLWQQAGYFDPAATTKPLLHMWSLAVEEQYYLIMPWLLVLFNRKIWMLILSVLLAASLTAWLWVAQAHPSAAFYLLPTRGWELLLGSLAALTPPKKFTQRQALVHLIRSAAILAVIVVPLHPIGALHPRSDTVIVSIAAALLLLTKAVRSANFIIRGLGRVGNISYSLYLVHWPVIVYLNAAWLGTPPSGVIVIGMAFTFLASYLLYQYVEEPFRKNDLIPGRTIAIGGLIASLVITALPIVLHELDHDGERYAKIRQANLGLSYQCLSNGGHFAAKKACATSARPRFLLWGDSFAMALAPGLAKAAAQQGIVQATFPACSPLLNTAGYFTSPSPYNRDYATHCIDFNKRVLAYAAASPWIDTVVLTSPFRLPVEPGNIELVQEESGLQDVPTSVGVAIIGMMRLINVLHSAGKRVVIVAPPPFTGFNIGECLERRALGLLYFGPYRNCNLPVKEYRRVAAPVLEFLRRVSAYTGVSVLSFDDTLCGKTWCRTRFHRNFIYMDNGHLSRIGSLLLVKHSHLLQRIESLPK